MFLIDAVQIEVDWQQAVAGFSLFVVYVVLNTGLETMNRNRSMSPSSPPSARTSVIKD